MLSEVALEPAQRILPEVTEVLGRDVLRAPHRWHGASELFEALRSRSEVDRFTQFLQRRLRAERGDEVSRELAKERVCRRERGGRLDGAEMEEACARIVSEGVLDALTDARRDADGR